VQKSLLKRLMELLAIPLSHQKTVDKRLVILKLIGVAALALSATVSAVGMGGIDVASSLGQPLKVDIELVSVNKVDKASLVARLASPDVYKGAGLEYPYGNKFKFQIESRANGELYLKVSSAQPINDPFVSLLVELTWSSGKLLREYTFLLDPPGYVPEQPKQAEVQSVAPAVQSIPTEPVVKPVPIAVEPGEIQPTTKIVEKPVQQAVPQPQPAKNVATGQINVKRGDTLNKIAAQNKPAEVSLERMLVALYRANADQFDGKNMNRIRAGKILRLPDQSELMGVAQPDALKEIRAQTADWNAYRQKLAGSAAPSSQPQATQQTVSGKIVSSVADKAPVVKESAKEVLKLSKGEAPGDKAATGAAGKSASAQDKKNAAQEDAIAKAKTLKEEQGRAELLKKNLQDMQRLAELKTKAAALAAKPESSVASQVAVSPVVTAASQVAAASAVKSEPAEKPKPKVVIPEPSMTSQIMSEPLYLAAGAVVLLGLGGVGFMLSRRKKPSATGAGKPAEDSGSATGRMMEPVAPSPDTGDFTSAAATKAETVPPSDDVDPISEADLFLNFGRDAQAEEILKEALQNTPDNHQIHLKLLGIYANRKDVNSFSTIARQLKDSGDEDAWHQAAAMGRKLEPGNPMYGGTGVVEDADSATMQTPALNTPDSNLDDTHGVQPSAPDVDFDLGEPATEFGSSPENDFLDNVEKTMVLSAEEMAAAQSGVMDFDVTSTHPSLSALTETNPDIPSASSSAPEAATQADVALPNLDDLVFDVTSTHPSLPAAQPEAQKPAEATQADDDGGMEFTLDFPTDDTANKPVAHSVDVDLAGISLNLDDVGTPAEPAVSPTKDEHWHEVATKLDLAKAYQEMGDATGAREILEEVVREGDAEQRETAQTLLDQLG